MQHLQWTSLTLYPPWKTHLNKERESQWISSNFPIRPCHSINQPIKPIHVPPAHYCRSHCGKSLGDNFSTDCERHHRAPKPAIHFTDTISLVRRARDYANRWHTRVEWETSLLPPIFDDFPLERRQKAWSNDVRTWQSCRDSAAHWWCSDDEDSQRTCSNFIQGGLG